MDSLPTLARLGALMLLGLSPGGCVLPPDRPPAPRAQNHPPAQPRAITSRGLEPARAPPEPGHGSRGPHGIGAPRATIAAALAVITRPALERDLEAIAKPWHHRSAALQRTLEQLPSEFKAVARFVVGL